MNKSIFAGVLLGVTTMLVGCAAEEGTEDDEDLETTESAAMHLGDITRRVQAAAKGGKPTPELYLSEAAKLADDRCRPPADFVGPYAGVPVTVTMTVETGSVRYVGIASPQNGTGLGTCVQKTLLGQAAHKSLGFTRTWTFLVGAPKKKKK